MQFLELFLGCEERHVSQLLLEPLVLVIHVASAIADPAFEVVLDFDFLGSWSAASHFPDWEALLGRLPSHDNLGLTKTRAHLSHELLLLAGKVLARDGQSAQKTPATHQHFVLELLAGSLLLEFPLPLKTLSHLALVDAFSDSWLWRC